MIWPLLQHRENIWRDKQSMTAGSTGPHFKGLPGLAPRPICCLKPFICSLGTVETTTAFAGFRIKFKPYCGPFKNLPIFGGWNRAIFLYKKRVLIIQKSSGRFLLCTRPKSFTIGQIGATLQQYKNSTYHMTFKMAAPKQINKTRKSQFVFIDI